MTKPWLGTWRVTGNRENVEKRTDVKFRDEHQWEDVVTVTTSEEAVMDLDDARLIASAPALARALCLVEWKGDCDGYASCPLCVGDGYVPHQANCPLDAALIAAGLDAAAREEVRRATK